MSFRPARLRALAGDIACAVGAAFSDAVRRAELPEKWLTLTLGLPYALDSARAAVKAEVYPGRWTTHFVIGSPEELDEELLSWIEQAYVFSERK